MIVRITSKFGSVDSVHKSPHSGIDLAMGEGTPLRSIQDGIVKHVLDCGDKNVGKGVIIQHEDGTQAIYGHLSQINVKEGAALHQGDMFVLSGNTGHSTGPHLHFGIKNADGSLLDPTPYVDANNAGDMSLWESMLYNGKVGQMDYFNIWEWLGGKFAEITIDGTADVISDFAVAFPFLAVVGGSMYALLNMVSKGAAKFGAVATVIYGLFLMRGYIS